MFGCFFLVFRSVATLILFLVVFFGLVFFLLATSVRDNFLSVEFYTSNFSENIIYDRFYDEVLLDSEYADTTEELLGNIDVTTGDVVEIVKEIIPPDYLQSQVEGSVQGAIDYLNKDTDTPEIFLELGPPLERIKPTLFKYMDGRIDELEDVPVTTIDELRQELEDLYRAVEQGKIPTRVPSIEDPEALVNRYVDDQIADLILVPAPTIGDFTRELERVYRELSSGQLPTRIPTVESVPIPLRGAVYDTVFQAIRDDPSIPESVKMGLQEQEQEIKAQLVESEQGDVKGALAIATRPLTGPVLDKFVDDAYDQVFQKLSDDPAFPRNALVGLDAERDAIKDQLGDGNIKEALKLGLRGLASPLIDEAIGDLREELDDQDRLDVLARAAEQNDETKEEFLEDVDVVRDWIDRAKLGISLTLVMIVVGAILMAAVQFPGLSSGLRWPGLTLFLSGLSFLIIGLVTKAVLPGRAEDLIEQAKAETSVIPDSMIKIIGDVLSSMVSDVAGGLIAPSATVMGIGLALIIASIAVRMLRIPIFSR